jgi:TolA-binding protein
VDGLLKDLIKQMLHRDPSQRPTAEDIHHAITDRGSQAEQQRHQLQQMQREIEHLRRIVDQQQQLGGEQQRGYRGGPTHGGGGAPAAQGMAWGAY